ncbi:telomerase-binding protein EST1A-like protein [Dinothrombium tinctorium]|uniref:Telomerase-binding protein EST1A-like protein n=1 Tax=Dinothrombium tinctorium TaxID=1965070 RepID=A0A443RJ83_9ACAR|nr:telomerase-binding protein EST1A-like protein [Dinothrombium tinctorium]
MSIDINYMKNAIEVYEKEGIKRCKERFRYVRSYKDISRYRQRLSQPNKEKCLNNKENIQEKVNSFRISSQQLYPEYLPNQILNSDQMAFAYEFVSKRTLSYVGEKDIKVSIKSKNKTTHTYTVMPMINYDGELLSPLYICLREINGEFGPIVKKTLPNFNNIYVDCSSSGKMTTYNVKKWTENVLKPNIQSKCLLNLDSYTAQIKQKLYDDVLGPEKCRLLIIPGKTTSILQPLDVFFNLQYRFLYKRIVKENKFQKLCDLGMRNEILKLHSIIHNQLTSPRFRNMFRYAWYASGLKSTRPEIFYTVEQVCFNFRVFTAKTDRRSQRSEAMEEKLKCSRKRPEMIYYRPGMMSKQKKGDNFTESNSIDSYCENGKDETQMASDSLCDHSNERKASKAKQNKKPDKQVYVPKARNFDERKTEERQERQERPKTRHNRRDAKDKYETIPDFVFENSKFNKLDEQRKGGHKQVNVSKEKPHQTVDKSTKTAIENSSNCDKKSSATDETPVLQATIQATSHENQSQALNSDKGNISEKDRETNVRRPTEPEQIQQANTVKPKAFKTNFQNNSKQKKYPNRSDFKFEQNLPPRLQKKLQMEKANQNKINFQADHLRQPEIEQSISIENSQIVNRGGIIRLPPNAAVTMAASTHSKPVLYQRSQENCSESQESLRARQYGILSPRQQLFNPYQPNKPCVVIRPTYQTPVISHPNSRSNLDMQAIQVTSPSANLSTYNRISHSYLHTQEHNPSVSSPSNNVPLDFHMSPAVTNNCIGNVAGFIEMRRREMEENPSEENKDMLNKLVEEATTFFENLLVNLQDKFEFSVDQYIEHEYDPEMPGYDVIKLAAISAQKIYLYLGDLARYKEQASGTSNFAKARSCYLKAQQLAPKNGRPYNQLALLAMYGKRKLDAVYYYMRSLAASNPFQSARENLLGIFDEVRKKYENAEKKRIEEKLSRLELSENISECSMCNISEERLEIWIRPDGTSSKHTSLVENVSAEEEFDMLTDVDLNKRFVLSFLHVHGKLFTKVGMETFIPSVNQMLLELRCLLKRKPSPISSQRLLQLMSISMFSVHHTALKETSPDYSPNYRSHLQEQAIQVTLATVSLLIERANSSLQEHMRHNQVNLVSDDVAELLPAIKIWTDWMSCQKQLWSPPPPSLAFGCKEDIWSLFANFLTTLGNINIRSVKLLPTKFDGCEPVILPEDTTLSGFIPLLGAPQCSSFVQPPYDKEKARTCLRISRIQFFGDYLCGIQKPYLEFDVEKKRFYSLVPTSNAEENDNTQSQNLDFSDNETDDIPTDSSSIENVNSISEEKSREEQEIEELWSRQEELKKAQMREEKVRQHLNAVLRKEKRTRMVIQPRFLIPDTNCFIDHLSKLQNLIQCGFYEIIIPLVVINELNGLTSRGSGTVAMSFSALVPDAQQTRTDSEHQKRVAQAAKKALDFLEMAFQNKNWRLKAITSKGSILDNINFTNESLQTKDITNDDLVLSCCLQFIKERPSERNLQESGEIINIFRETVLLTEDRNLRVKALSQNVPVKSLPVFLQWANIP